MKADSTQQQFKAEIKSWLKLQGKGYAWLAEKCDVSESTLRNWLSKKIIPPEKIAAIQNITSLLPLTLPFQRERQNIYTHTAAPETGERPLTPIDLAIDSSPRIQTQTQITLTLSSSEQNKLEHKAFAQGMTLSEYLDSLLSAALKDKE